MMLAPGDCLAGKYRIDQVLGRGGMGVVVAAHHLVLDEAVAIKFLLPEILESAEAVMRFEREARAAVKIKSEHVARVIDVGRMDSGAPYLVMELLRGRDLSDVLVERGPLPVEDVIDYVLQAGEALAEAHGLGIVHRDLKPANLFLTHRADGSPCVKVLDFGISKFINSAGTNDQNRTQTATVLGSPMYMSPEQLMSARDVDTRTDIWALGVICFELLTGKGPFAGDTLPQLCMAISLGAPFRLRQSRPDLPVELEAILLRCLAKDREQRYGSVAQLASALVQFAPERARLSSDRIERLARSAGFTDSDLGVSPRLTGGASAITDRSSQTVAEFGQTQSRIPKTKWWAGAIGGALLILLALAALARMRGAPAPSSQLRSVGTAAAAPPLATPEALAPSVTTAQEGAVVPPPPVQGDPTHAIERAPAPTAAPKRIKLPKVSSAQKAPASTGAAAPQSLDCSVPYYYDLRGNKVFKEACL